MIVRPRPTAWQLLYILRGTVLPRVLPQVLGVSGLSCLAVWGPRNLGIHLPPSTAVPMSLLGLALSIFLGFRNNASYDRWWEARKHWGALIIELRSLARETVALLDDGAVPGVPVQGRQEARRLIHRGIAFAYAFAGYLRGHDDRENLARFLSPEEAGRVRASINPPDALLREMANELASLRRTGRLADIPWQTLSERVGALSAVLAACERIRFTPLPFAYTVLLHRTAYLFCLILPFGLAEMLGWLAPVLSAILAYTFFGLDALGDELENPFGQVPNGLPLLAIARTAERGLLEALGEPTPEPLQPQSYVLM
ncbi:bestrophin family protein [Stigmatella sp. ncwal1]|uniref:Bestrophin family protein n=1 Tax=Stigmatella ashevillensis TaxID=2995309 RepID=A0ABT5DBW4_9BACT|nr:bestrophin family protein [Stigmatella ashevillena]MDC0711172.1 bestrophin family protein [Stigmatella ashevillena]